METVSVRDVFDQVFPVGAPKKIAGKLLEDMGMTDAVMPAPAEDAGHEAMVADAFLAVVTAVWKDDKLDTKAKLAKIKDVAAAQEKLLGTDAPAAPAEGDAKEEDDKKEEGAAKEEGDPADEKKDGAAKEGKPISVGRLMEAARKYKVDDAAILEEAARLPELRAVRLLEGFGRRGLAAAETPRSAARSTKVSEVVPEGWDNFKKHLREGLAKEEPGFLLEAND